MFVGVAEITLQVPAAQSLKEKRQVLNSIKDRLRQRYQLSIAEVANQDKWQLATLGFAYVSSSKAHVLEVLDKAIRELEDLPFCQVLHIQRDVY